MTFERNIFSLENGEGGTCFALRLVHLNVHEVFGVTSYDLIARGL